MNFLKSTWQQIVATALSLIFIGALTFVFTKVDESMRKSEENEKRIMVMETIMESDLQKSIDSLKDQLQNTSSRLGTMGATQKRIEIMVTRLEVLVDKIEDN